MCATGSIQYTGTTTAYYTHGKSYPIVSVVPAGPGNDAGLYLVQADNGSFNGVTSGDADWTLEALYVPVKVV